VSEAPSTTFVITGEEIRRSGAPSLPEILRRVPGVDVRVISAVDGQVGLRGFAFEVSDRILVMIDGRTAYIDFFGGTTWEMLPVSLLDIDRVEIILGPGASVYGNKAMLGVINVITRSANDFPVLEARVDAGLPEEGRVAARYGAIAGSWRFRATGLARRLTLFETGRPVSAAGGGTLSATWSPSAGTEVLLESGAYTGNVFMIPTGSQLQEFDATQAYGRLRARHGLGGPGAPDGTVNLDLVWNTGHISSPTFPGSAAPLRADYQTPYIVAHHALRTHLFGLPMNVIWGGDVRLSTLASTITSGERPLWNVAAFASDEVLLGRWRLTAGVRVDRPTVGDATVSPRLSVVWSPVAGHQLRASFNTGYNNPHQLHYFADFTMPGSGTVIGNRDLSPEHVLYGEVGWAGGLTPWLRAFANAFAYQFTDWMSLDPLSVPLGDPIPWGNNKPFTTVGGELGLDVNVRRVFSAYANYAYIDTLGSGVQPYGVDPQGSPRHKVGAGMRLGLEEGSYLDVAAQWVGPSFIARATKLPPEVFEVTRLEGYVAAHARAGYAFRNGLDLSLAVSNALDDRTQQFPVSPKEERPERRFTATIAYYP
jgi:iron complex outermembrane receptor protein